MDNRKHKFVSRSFQNHMSYIPKIVNDKYYQICSYKNPGNGMYHIRRFVINKNHEFTTIESKYVKQRNLNKFFSSHNPAEFTVIPAYDLEQVPYPNMSSVITAQSELLNDKSDYTGFAKF